MTDLEKHWDDLPVGPVPADAVLREARRAAAAERRLGPGRRLKRSLAAVVVLGGVAAAFVGGMSVSPPSTTDGDGGSADGAGAAEAGGGAGGGALDIAPAAFQGELQAPESCEDLLQHYVDRGVDLVGAYGWGGTYPILRDAPSADAELSYRDGAMPRGGHAPNLRSPADAKAAPSLAESSLTGTNVQEAGVDEPDAVKTSGTLLVRLRGAELTTYDVAGAAVREVGTLDLGDFHDGEILLAGDTVVAIGNDGTGVPRDYAYDDAGNPVAPQQTRVLTVDVADPAAPTLEQTVDYDAALVAARQHGDDVRLVLSKGLPDLDFTTDGRRPAADARANRKLVEQTTLDDWLPHVAVDGGEPTDLLECDRVAIPRAEIGLATMAVVGFDAADPGAVGSGSLGLAGDAPMTYESPDHLYLAATGGTGGFGGFGGCFDCFTRTSGAAPDGTTHVYDFALYGTGATYVGAGEVEGYVRDRWSMDESDGVLRLAVGPSTETENANSIVTMKADGDALEEIGRLDGLGRGEDIKSVRWFDGLAILVTFREVDPLYAIDLTDDTDPTLLGELKIPGFSSYLHPLGNERLVGVGSDGRGGAQAGFFSLVDVTEPKQLDVTSYGAGSYAKAGDDPRQFTWLPDERVVLTVIAKGRTGYVSRIRLADGRMSNEMTKVELGSDVDQVRTVPLADGRVALVTGEDVRFFDVD